MYGVSEVGLVHDEMRLEWFHGDRIIADESSFLSKIDVICRCAGGGETEVGLVPQQDAL